jgi:MFS family permease
MTTIDDHPVKLTGKQRLTLVLLLGASFMLSVDFSILNIALPQVGAAVGLDLPALPWIATAYALPAAGFALLFGRIADLFGRRRMFLTGIALMAAASTAGGLATNPVLLLAARAVQGFATAMATPAALSLLTTAFTDEKQRARVLGLNGALLSGGFTVGALVGGTMVGALSWRWAFLVNVPVAALILAFTPFVVPPSCNPSRVKLDVPGAICVTAGLLAFAFGVTNRNLYALIGGLVLLLVFWQIELSSPAPLAAVSILSRPTVKWGNLAGLIVFSMESALVFLMTLYLQEVLHFAPMTTGLIFGVPGLASVAAGVVGGKLIARYGARCILGVALLMQSGFTAPLLLLGGSPLSLWILIPSLFIGFFGHVTAIVGFMVTATSGLAEAEQGLATGLASMTQQIAITVGIPILGAVAATQANLLSGIHAALAVNVLVTGSVAAIVWTGLRAGSEANAVSAREQFSEVLHEELSPL